MDFAITRRAFLAVTSSTLATVAIGRKAVQADSRPLSPGPLYGRVGRRGLGPATAKLPTLGEVVTLDGRTLLVRHEGNRRLAPGKSVWLSPDADGVLSILYAEV
jgi:hypothetical protein